MADAIAHPDTSEGPPRPARSALSGRQFSNIPALLLRDNVQWILVVRAERGEISTESERGGRDHKYWRMGDKGCMIVIMLSDNPLDVGDGFHEVVSPMR